MQNVCLSFDKINVIIACGEDIYGRHCIKKSNNGDFHPYKVVIIVFDIKSCSFSVVKSKQTRLQFLVLEKFITCLHPLETTWHRFNPISPLAQAKMGGIVNKVNYADGGGGCYPLGMKA